MTEKYFDLTRTGDESFAKELRPNNEEQERINQILILPDFIFLSEEEKTMIWRFRYSIIDNGKALTKFLQSVRFTEEKEMKEAISLMKKWA